MTAPVDAITPMAPSDASPATSSWLHRLAPVGVALLCLLAAAWTSRDLGLTTDEPRYIENSQRLQAWFGDLFNSGPTIAFAEERLAEGWYWARTASKNLPLVSLVGTIGQFTLGLFDSPPHAHRWGNLLVLAATCGVIFTWIREELSTQAATVAVLALIGMPRVWTHAQLMSIDPLVASFQVMGCWALWNSRGQHTWRWPVTFGVLAGIGAMSKPTFWFIVPLWVLWGVLTGPRSNRKAGVCLVTVAPLMALALMPSWWSNPIGGFLGYIDLLVNDPVGWKIDVYYLGDIFQAELIAGEVPTPVPWHSVPLLSTITTPPWIIGLVLFEVFSLSLPLLANRLAYRAKHRSDTPPRHPAPSLLTGLWLLAALALPLIVMLPSTPAHDGTGPPSTSLQSWPALGLNDSDAGSLTAPILGMAGLQSSSLWLSRPEPTWPSTLPAFPTTTFSSVVFLKPLVRSASPARYQYHAARFTRSVTGGNCSIARRSRTCSPICRKVPA